MKIPYQITPRTITAIAGSTTLVADTTHANFDKIKKMLSSDSTDIDALKSLFDVGHAIQSYGKGKLMVQHGIVLYNNVKLNDYVSNRILQFMNENLPVEPLVNFIDRLMANPSARAICELYKFLENRNMPLTPDGCFIAYKGVNNDYWSVTGNKNTIVLQGQVDNTGRILNSIGATIEVQRNCVDDDCNVPCGAGIHAGSLEYASSFGPKIVLVKIDPADVVSVPTDTGCQKLRACKYVVVGENEREEALPDSYTNAYSTKSDEEAEYQRGYDDGMSDRETDRGNNEKNFVDGDYKNGYVDGYNAVDYDCDCGDDCDC